MKKVIFGLSMIALLASCGGNESTNNTAEASGPTGELKIAYYMQDSVATSFTYFKDKQEKLEAKARKLEEQLMGLQQELQTMGANYQRKMSAGLLSQNDAAAYERRLAQKQQQIQVLQQTDGADIERESYEATMDLMEKMESYGKSFSQENGYNVLLNWQSGGQVLYIDSTMDVTSEFIKYINAKADSAQEEESEESAE